MDATFDQLEGSRNPAARASLPDHPRREATMGEFGAARQHTKFLCDAIGVPF